MSLTLDYQNSLARIETEVKRHCAEKWRALPGYHDSDINFFVENILPFVRAGQESAIALTDAYMSELLGVTPVGLDASAIIANIRPGTLPPEVIGRSFQTVWSALQDIAFREALRRGEARLVSTVGMDVLMAARDASRVYGKVNDLVAGFRRVAYPGCCDFCTDVNGAFVHSEDANPLHNNCKCSLEPIMKGTPEADAPRTSFAPGTIHGDVMIREHGELGPMITFKNDDFTSFEDLPKSYQRQTERLAREQDQPAA